MEQKNAGVGSDLPAANVGNDFASLTPCERDGLCGTNCHGKTSCEILSNQLNCITITEVLPSFLCNIRAKLCGEIDPGRLDCIHQRIRRPRHIFQGREASGFDSKGIQKATLVPLRNRLCISKRPPNILTRSFTDASPNPLFPEVNDSILSKSKP